MDIGNDVAGVILTIHDQQQVAFPEEDGIHLYPGQATSVGVKQVRSASGLIRCANNHPLHSVTSHI